MDISNFLAYTSTFGTLYIVTCPSLFFLRLVIILKLRKSQIVENIGAAESQRKDSDQKIKDYDKIINNEAKIEAKNYI